MKNYYLGLLALSLLIFMTSCEKDDPIIPNEEELITTVVYELTNQSTGQIITASYKDIDGDGPIEPVIDDINLAVNTNYAAKTFFLNEQETPAENITDEIKEEGDEHQIFFNSSVSGISISYNDEDADGNPIGLQTILTTGNAGTGTLGITLRHEPIKSADGVIDGNIANAGGETDIEIGFIINVE